MKLFTAILLLLSITASAQQYKLQPLPLTLMYVSGASKGMSDVLMFHYDHFQRIHPGANPQFWNPAISWLNKYKNGDPSQGEAFPLSSTLFSPFLDGWHASNGLSKVSCIGAVVIKIGKKQKLRYYICDFVVYSLAYSAGFWTTYEIIYR